jgi:CRISPR-associated protein Cas5d
MEERSFEVKVGGDFACFSRPELKVERVTYPVMTPSAARGVLEAIFWKPEVRWQIREIRVLRPIRHFSLLRNEIESRQGSQPIPIASSRQQRVSLVLRDVEYVIRAQLVLKYYADAPIKKYTDQFVRRLTRGQCHHMPYLGTREFSAWFEPATGDETPVPLYQELGQMLFDIAYCPDTGRTELEFLSHGPQGRQTVTGYAEPLFFDARLRAGVLSVPLEKYDELYAREEGASVS